jgi:hypothetical protein
LGLDPRTGGAGHASDRSADGWDSVMLTYTSLLRVSGKMLCFYNWIGFGRAGFGYAVAEDSGGSQLRAVA